MKHAKSFFIVVFIVLFAYGAVGLYNLPMASFEGDLTRIGMLPESAFGWRKPQPAIDPAWLTQSPLQEADVLVLGDSFSDTRVWQTALTRRGLKVHTTHWGKTNGVCADFEPWLRTQGFRGQYVVLQIIERNFQDEIGKYVNCRQTQVRLRVFSDKGHSPPITSFNPDQTDYSGRFSVGIQTARNYRDYERISGSPDFKVAVLPNGTKVARIDKGCELFSHRRCADNLFLGADQPTDIAEPALQNMHTLNARLQHITPIWAIVPNKSTAYLYPDKQFWNQAEKLFHAPNLLRMTQQAIAEKTIDLYPANNTHFSTTGYLLMGEAIYQSIRLAEESP